MRRDEMRDERLEMNMLNNVCWSNAPISHN